MENIIIKTSSDILKYKNLYNYNFIIIKDLLCLKNNIIILKKIVTKFPFISINGLQNKDLYIYINLFLHKNNLESIYKEYKIVIKGVGCNAKCPMCFDWKRKGNIEKQSLFLDKIVDNIKKDKVSFKTVNLIGGEPLLIYSKILEILKIFKKEAINFGFSTNASLLTKKIIDELIVNGLEIFEFSLDFPNEKHDKWRNLDGAYEKIIKYTNYIKNKGKTVIWNTVVGTFNYNDILDFEELYKISKPNIHSFILIENDYNDININFLPENESLLKLENNIKNKLENNDIKIILNGFKKNINKNRICHIPLYKKNFIIKDNGISISPCYTHSNINDFKNFTNTAIEGNCSEVCDISFKKNHHFLNK